jgi:hypothetical protein
METSYRELIDQVKADPNNANKIELLKLRELFICCASMLYNEDYIDVINILTGANINRKDIVALSDRFKKEFKIKEKELRKRESEEDVFTSILNYSSP